MPDITYQDGQDNGGGSGLTSMSFPYTVGSGSNRLLLLGCMGTTGNNITGATYPVSSVATAMSLVSAYASGGGRYIYLFYLLNPDSGNHSIEISTNGNGSIWATAVDYYNCKQVAPNGSNTNTVGSGPLNVGITPSASNVRLILYGRSFGPSIGAGSNTTLRDTNTADPYLGFLESTGLKVATVPAIVTMTGSGTLNAIVAGFESAAGATFGDGAGAPAGLGTLTAIGTALLSAAGLLTGTATTTGTGTGIASAAGSIPTGSTVAGTSEESAIVSAIGTAQGFTTLAGATAALATLSAVGHLTGLGTVLGRTASSGQAPDSSDIDAALVQYLQADGILSNLMPDGVYFSLAPEQMTQYVLVSLADSSDDFTFSARAFEVYTYAVKAVELWTASTRNIKAAAARIDVLLDPQPPSSPLALTIPGYQLKLSRRESRIRYDEIDDVDPSIRWSHRGAQYSVWVAPSTTGT